MMICLIFNQAHAQNDQGIKHARILNVSTDLPEIGNWYRIPKGKEKMTINVEAKNTETVLFWLVPTGSKTWRERKLIGYDKDGSDGWSLTWEFGNEPPLQDHIHIQALGTGSISDWIINVTTANP